MILKPSPIRRDSRPSFSVSGEVLTIDGEDFDFSGIPNGGTIPTEAISSVWISGDVSRDENGDLGPIPILLSHGPNAPEATRFPDPVTVTDGPVTLPPYDEEPEA